MHPSHEPCLDGDRLSTLATRSGGLPVKRALDVLIGLLIGLLLIAPALAVAALVLITSPGPILYWSARVGRHGRIFQMPKFRTMKVGTPQVATDKLADPASRLTPIGGMLRKLSLDELPQLWSVIKGDMSLVGPRPALFNQDELIAARKARGIDALRPGITGWAQVNGRDDILESRKIELDEEYLRRRSLRFDLRILWLTLWRVIGSHGVAH
jgi:O-antigen biosynthesis protein WbqP